MSGKVILSGVSIKKFSNGYKLYKNGKPYFIKGVGGYTHLKELKERGGNSIRVWDTNDADRILNQAQKNDLTVMLGLWIVREREGFNYFDEQAVSKLKEKIKADVLRYRKHPALLVWCLGNELENGNTNAKSWKVINEIAVMIRELDPNHPLTLAVNSISPRVIRTIKKDCPAIELLSFNVYAALPYLTEKLMQAEWDGPYIISEYSAKGYWEVPTTYWEAPAELNSTQKTEFVSKLYKKYIRTHDTKCLGAYAFFWGSKQECTPTWFSILDEEGRKMAMADMLQYMWTGRYPANRAPNIGTISLTMENKVHVNQLSSGETYLAQVQANDLEADSLSYKWEILPESNWADLDGSVDKEVKPLPIKNLLLVDNTASVKLKSPLKKGPYRIFVYVYDGKGSFATANIPFLVTDDIRM